MKDNELPTSRRQNPSLPLLALPVKMGGFQHVREAPNKCSHVHLETLGSAFNDIWRQLEQFLTQAADGIIGHPKSSHWNESIVKWAMRCSRYATDELHTGA